MRTTKHIEVPIPTLLKLWEMGKMQKMGEQKKEILLDFYFNPHTKETRLEFLGVEISPSDTIEEFIKDIIDYYEGELIVPDYNLGHDHHDIARRPAPPRILLPLPFRPGIDHVQLIAHRLSANVHHSLFVTLEHHLLTNHRRLPALDPPPIG